MLHDYKNKLLRKLSPEDLSAFAPSLERVEMAAKSTLLQANELIEHVYFPDSGICSVLAVSASEKPNEIGMYGCEGMSNFVIRPGDKSYFRNVVMIPGTAWRVGAEAFSKALLTLPTLNEVTLRYKDACAIQFGYSAYANGIFSIEERLARWILMAADRVGTDKFSIVHDTLAQLLSVRRAGVTTAIHVLEGAGAIKSDRGSVTIRDREKLEELAGDSYGTAESAYRELMGS
jgi:CRP-like cAMP-binding protein